jgi:tetratricopeptide (TPR) repeat protein
MKLLKVTVSALLLLGTQAAVANVIDLEDLIDFGFGFGELQDRELTLALAEINGGEIDAAVSRIRRYMVSNPGSAPAEELLGTALALQGDLEAGLERLRRAVQMNASQSTAYTKIGDILVAQGRPDEAESYFRQAIDAGPGDYRAHQRLGILEEDRGNHRTAIEHFERGIAPTDPRYVGVKLNLGSLYNLTGQPAKTLALFEPILDELDADPAGLLILGTARLATNDIAAAVSAFERVRALDPDNAGAAMSLGIAYRDAGAFEDSLAELQQAVDFEGASPVNQYQLGETYIALQRPQEALGAYERAQALSGDASSTPLPIAQRIAAANALSGNVELAISMLTTLRDAGSLNAVGYRQLATLNEQQANYETALEVYRELVQRDPESIDAHFELGRLSAALLDYESSTAAFEQGLTLAPDNPQFLRALAVVHSRRGDYPAALDVANRLVDSSERNPEGLFLLGSIYDDAGDKDRAATVYEEVLDNEDNHISALNNLAVIRSAEGRHDDAIDLARRAARLAPENVAVADTYGWAVYHSGDLERARRILAEGIDGSPEYAPIYYHLAVVQFELGNTGPARANVSRALEISEIFSEADEARALLARL